MGKQIIKKERKTKTSLFYCTFSPAKQDKEHDWQETLTLSCLNPHRHTIHYCCAWNATARVNTVSGNTQTNWWLNACNTDSVKYGWRMTHKRYALRFKLILNYECWMLNCGRATSLPILKIPRLARNDRLALLAMNNEWWIMKNWGRHIRA